MGSLLLKFLAGGLAGLAAWAIMEPFKPGLYDPKWAQWEGMFMLVLGGLVGLAVGGLDGYTRGGKVHLIRGLGMGLIFGAIGATFGHGIGATLSTLIFGNAITSGALPVQILARTLAFIPIGLCLGAAIGGSSLTLKRAIQGATGGAIGAAIGGLSFDIIGTLTASAQLSAMGTATGEVGGPSRAIATGIMGAAIGLFIGLVELLTRSAWLRLSLGRNEGKEWSIDAAQTFIGRSESAGVPLFGDPNVAPIHASIRKQGGQYILVDGGSPIGTLLNGYPVQQAVLAPGSVIQIGSFALTFLIKGTPAPQRGPEAYPGQAYPMGGAMAYPAAPTAPAPGPGYPGPGQPTQAFPAAPGVGNQTVAYAAPAPGGFALTAIDGPMAGQRFPVTGALEIGREASGVRLAGDANASRRHASVTTGLGGVGVQDLGSTNGTFVNGQRVTTAEARPGDLIKIGSTTFRVEAA